MSEVFAGKGARQVCAVCREWQKGALAILGGCGARVEHLGQAVCCQPSSEPCNCRVCGGLASLDICRRLDNFCLLLDVLRSNFIITLPLLLVNLF